MIAPHFDLPLSPSSGFKAIDKLRPGDSRSRRGLYSCLWVPSPVSHSLPGQILTIAEVAFVCSAKAQPCSQLPSGPPLSAPRWHLHAAKIAEKCRSRTTQDVCVIARSKRESSRYRHRRIILPSTAAGFTVESRDGNATTVRG